MPTILVIDDDDGVRETIREMLELRGYEVVTAHNGRMALQILNERGADLVITDLFMPEMEGIETIMVLRASRPGMPIIAISGGELGNALHLLKAAQHLGAIETLPKPIRYDDLIRVVRNTLGEFG